jgi:hypothetical protein
MAALESHKPILSDPPMPPLAGARAEQPFGTGGIASGGDSFPFAQNDLFAAGLDSAVSVNADTSLRGCEDLAQTLKITWSSGNR